MPNVMIDLASLTPEEAIALRDRLLALHPVEAPPMSNVERLAAEAMRRWDDLFPDWEKSVAALHAHFAERRAKYEAATVPGRFYVQQYGDACGIRRWRVMDRYTEAVARFALDGLGPVKPQRGFRSRQEASLCACRLEEYYADAVASCHAKPIVVPMPKAEPASGESQATPTLAPYFAQPHRVNIDGRLHSKWRVVERETGNIASIEGDDGLMPLHKLSTFAVAQQYVERLTSTHYKEHHDLSKAA